MKLLTGEEQLEVLRKLNDKYRDDDERPTRAMEDEALCEAQLKKVVEDIGTYRFAEPIQVPEYGREPIIICIPLEDWQALLEEVI